MAKIINYVVSTERKTPISSASIEHPVNREKAEAFVKNRLKEFQDSGYTCTALTPLSFLKEVARWEIKKGADVFYFIVDEQIDEDHSK
jgi:hypothetical protein